MVPQLLIEGSGGNTHECIASHDKTKNKKQKTHRFSLHQSHICIGMMQHVSGERPHQTLLIFSHIPVADHNQLHPSFVREATHFVLGTRAWEYDHFKVGHIALSALSGVEGRK
jgi:hypothetical protein